MTEICHRNEVWDRRSDTQAHQSMTYYEHSIRGKVEMCLYEPYNNANVDDEWLDDITPINQAEIGIINFQTISDVAINVSTKFFHCLPW